jgi:hypothetical protein
MLLGWSAAQTPVRRRATCLWGAAGAAFALAVSAKVFAIAALAGIGAVFVTTRVRGIQAPPTRSDATSFLAPTNGDAWSKRSGDVAWSLGAFLAGVAMVQVIEGLFYLWAAGDFFFSLRATLSASENVPSFTTEGASKMSVLAMIWDRLTIFHHQSTSGWGVLAIPFWPIVLLVALLDRSARVLAAWAVAAFVLVAFVPVSFAAGARAYPIFHGRHILPACVPFALCLAWCVCRAGKALLRPRWRSSAWALAAVAVVALALVDGRALNGFRDRDTSRVGRAIAQMIPSIPDDGRDIFMTPSMYWRFRALFPDALRGRLRVAASEDAPTWWRHVCPDIAKRARPLPGPNEAYLVATPRQLRGEAEHWDYGVPLPSEGLASWGESPTLAGFVRDSDRHIRALPDAHHAIETVLLLSGRPAGAVAAAD